MSNFKTVMQMRKNQEISWLLRDKYAGKQTPAFFDDIKRLKDGLPIDYLIGWVPFLDAKIDLSLHPLIPRPETEYWTKKAIEYMAATKKCSLRVLDMFAGSGCIGIAVLKAIPHAKVDFAEVDGHALKQIKKNCRLNNINESRFNIYESDIFSSVPTKLYDYILANPPYIPTDSKYIEKSVQKYEPPNALFAGKDGLEIVKPFLEQAKRHLNKGGHLWMEFDSPKKRTIESLMKRTYARKYVFGKDQFGKWRWVEFAEVKIC